MANLKNSYGNFKTGLNKAIVIFACAGLFGGLGAYRGLVGSGKSTAVEPLDTVPPVSVIKKPVNTAAYHNDTIDTPQSILLLYYGGKITRYYKEGNNSFKMQMPYFVHEWWHHHNALQQYRTAYDLSPEEYFKLCMHDEISANLAAILTARFEYLASDNKKSVIKRYKNTYMKFYFEALEKKQIKPESNDPIEREKEWFFLANGVRDMWMRLFYKSYLPRTIGMVDRFIARKGLVKDSGKNYEKIRHRMFTIGGIDFAQYMDQDIMPYNSKIQMAENLRHVDDLRDGGKETVDYINGKYPLLREVGFQDQHLMFQHVLISARLSRLFKDVDAADLRQNASLVTSYYKQVWNSFRHDKNYVDLVNKFSYIMPIKLRTKTDEKVYADAISQIYTVNGVDLSELIEGFNAKRVPYLDKPVDKNYFDNLGFTQKYTFLGTFTPEGMALEHLKNKHPAKKNPSTSPLPQVKRRISEDFYIRVPNFYEDILVNPPQETLDEIYKTMRHFSAIPDVLKSCNSAAKQKYAEEHPDTIAKLHLGKEYI